MDPNSGQQRRGGTIDKINSAVNTAKNIKNLFSAGRTAMGATEAVSTSEIWVPIAIGLAIILIIVFVILLGSGSGSALELGQQPGPGVSGPPGGGNNSCGKGSLDYSIPFKDSSVSPVDISLVKDEILSQWPDAKLWNWNTIVSQSVQAGWNPSFVLALWVEESGAQGQSGYSDPLGCDSGTPTTDINKALSCVFNSFAQTNNFEDFMCTYGGDGFHNAPCTFNTENPGFPGDIKYWYTKLSGGAPLDCNSVAPNFSGWPTTGWIMQGPNGLTDHNRLYTESGGTHQAVDIANVIGTPIYATFNGTVSKIYTGYSNPDAGRTGNTIIVEVSGNPGASIVYGHLDKIMVTERETVASGTLLGTMGNTGSSTGPHLHWEFRNIPLAPPYIPEPITPPSCDIGGPVNIPCNPAFVSYTTATPTPGENQAYWFLLHRKSMREDFYQGAPGDVSQSHLVKEFTVRVGKPGERPTPLPSLAGRDYWLITSRRDTTGDPSTSPRFLTLDIPYPSPYYGPVLYSECGPNGNQQCNWGTPGEFGLHGTDGHPERVFNDGSTNSDWSSGCIRHLDNDILYLDSQLGHLIDNGQEIRYYIHDD